MERTIAPARITSRLTDLGLIAGRRLTARCFIAAGLGAIGFWLLATLSLSLSRFDSTLASVWLPNACAVAFLLHTRLSNELPFYAAIFVAGIIGNATAGTPIEVSVVYAFANLLNISVVIFLTRRNCGVEPDMTRIEHLARFVWAGGLVGPLLSASFAAIAMGPDDDAIWAGATAWFLTDSMGMILIVPTALLVIDAARNWRKLKLDDVFENIFLLGIGAICVLLVFEQARHTLLFLVPPITLFFAFRLGSLGTALFVSIVAIVAAAMTWLGYGPIVDTATSEIARVHVIQAFIAANFLTGLPVAAILAGRDRIMGELDAGRRELALLTENATDALMCFDLNGVCTYASSSVETVLAEPVDTFLGKRPSDRMHKDARDRISLAQERLISGASEQERFTYRRFHDAPDGSPVFLEAECAIAYDPETGEREGIVVSARDVTERVELELLLTRARRHAENAARAKSEFLANMSHEIRTPMNGVLGFAELMLQGNLDPDQKRHTTMIVESGRSMMLLLNDILDLSKIEAGQIAIDLAPIDLEATIRECVALHRPTAEKKGLKLTFGRVGGDSTKDDSVWVETDGLRLRQIVLNLVGNAVKFTGTGHIDITYGFVGSEFNVRVTDTGIGISAERVETIFKPFTQGENDTSRRFGGTGLGLTISRQLAELLGGHIDVQSEPGVGSCFTLTLPGMRVEPDNKPVPEPESGISQLLPESLPHSGRILLAEDNDVNRELMVEMLTRFGQKVEIAHDGNEAISLVIDSVLREKQFDLVLMDIQMPGCDGYAATQAIRAEGIGPNTLPIIALTANAFPEDIAAARDAGMQAHLAKPLDFKALARALQRWLPTRIVEDQEIDRAGDGHDPAAATTHCDLPGRTPAPGQKQGLVKSPILVKRWLERRRETLDAVRDALESETLGESDTGADEREALAQSVHKLAGTAGMFGEAKLGDQAAAFERSLRLNLNRDVQEALAHDLLEIADDGEEEFDAMREARG